MNALVERELNEPIKGRYWNPQFVQVITRDPFVSNYSEALMLCVHFPFPWEM